ncbi:Hypothetical predicted protein, partial [Paramuricea clavata]
ASQPTTFSIFSPTLAQLIKKRLIVSHNTSCHKEIQTWLYSIFESNETLNEYYRRLKTKAVQCNFHSEEAEIKTQIIHKTRDSRLRKKALRETMTLKQILNYGNTLERTDEQSKRL